MKDRFVEHYGERTNQQALQIHYSQSIYYVFWWVIADRVSDGLYQAAFEFGCGSGQLAELLFDKGLQTYIGIDISQQCIDMARGRKLHYTMWDNRSHRRHLSGFRFYVDDIMTTEFTTYDYQVCISTEVLEHLEDDLGALDRIRPGTRCFMSVPNCPSPTHVRTFQSCQEVTDRYGDKFSDVRVDPFVIHGSMGLRKMVFLLDGVKK